MSTYASWINFAIAILAFFAAAASSVAAWKSKAISDLALAISEQQIDSSVFTSGWKIVTRNERLKVHFQIRNEGGSAAEIKEVSIRTELTIPPYREGAITPTDRDFKEFYGLSGATVCLDHVLLYPKQGWMCSKDLRSDLMADGVAEQTLQSGQPVYFFGRILYSNRSNEIRATLFGFQIMRIDGEYQITPVSKYYRTVTFDQS